MTAREFWRALVRNRGVGASIFAACFLSALALAVTSRPVYQATALFQVERLEDIGSDPRAWEVAHWEVTPRLNADVLEKWLGQEDVLRDIIDRAGERDQVTAVQLNHHLSVIPAGDRGIFEATVWDTSPARAQRLANATAEVIGEKAATLLQQDRQVLVSHIRNILSGMRTLLEQQPPAETADQTARVTVPPDAARLRHSAMAEAYMHLEAQLVSLEVMQRTFPVKATLLEKAGRPVAPVTPTRALYLLLGTTTGIVLGLAGALVRETLRGANTSD